MKYFLFLLLPLMAMGAIRTVDPNGGGGFTSVYAANLAASSGDSIMLINGPWRSNESVKISLKSDIWMESTTRDTLYAVASKLIEPVGNNNNFTNIVFAYDSSLTYTVSTFLINANDKCNHAYYNCDFINYLTADHGANLAVGVRYGNYFGEVLDSNVILNHCIFYNVNYQASKSMSLTGGASNKNTQITDCIFVGNSRVFTGVNWSIKNTIFHEQGSMENSILGDSLTLNKVWMSAGDSSEVDAPVECWSSDEQVTRKLKHCRYNQVYIYNKAHNLLVLDGQDSAIVENCAFITTTNYVQAPMILFGHVTNTTTVDSVTNLRIRNVDVYQYSGDFAVLAFGLTPIHHDNRCDGLIVTSPNTHLGDLGINDTLRNSAFVDATIDFSAIGDTVKQYVGVGKQLLIDSLWCRFVNRRYAATIGYVPEDDRAMKYLTTEDITASTGSYTSQCSLSVNFYHHNGIVDRSAWNSNSFYTGDTAQVIWQYTTDTTGEWITAHTDTLVAGEVVTKEIVGLTDTVYSRVITNVLSDGETHIHDTVPYARIDIVGEIEDSVVIQTVYPFAGSTVGGDTFYVTGVNLDSATFTLNGLVCGILDQNEAVAVLITPPNSAGTYDLIAVHGEAKDTGAFTYDAPVPFTDIYVDHTMLTNNTSTYDVENRSPTGGNKKCFKTIQMAIDSMVAGSHIMIRNGVYDENVKLPWTKNGTSWTQGHYNIVESYPNEWAIVDGGNDSSFVIGLVTDNLITRPTKYWKFRKLEVMGGRLASTNASASGFHMNKGPFDIDSCVIHDNYATVSSGDINAGIVGYGWELCVIQNCVFYNNGSSLMDNDNFADIAIFSSYNYPSMGTGYVFAIDTKARTRNTYKNNYFMKGDFGRGGIFGKGGQILCGQNLDGEHFNYNYSWYGDNIHHNIFENRVYGIRMPTTYVQVHHNIFYQCREGFYTSNPDDYMIQAACAYNNTGIQCSSAVVRLSNTMEAEEYCTNYERTLWGWILNNVADSSGWFSMWAEEEFTAMRTSGDNTANYDSTYVNRNYSHAAIAHDYDETGFMFYMEGLIRYTVDTYTKGTNYLAVPTTPDNLWVNLFIPDGDHVVSGSVTIANGGIGGNHPYLPLTLPSYIGAVDPEDTAWVARVLNLGALGDTVENPIPDPPVIDSVSPLKVKPDSVFTIYGLFSGTIDSVKMNSVKITPTTTDEDSINITVPSWMPRGYYSDSVFTSGGAAACYHCSRVIVPALDTVILGVQP